MVHQLQQLPGTVAAHHRGEIENSVIGAGSLIKGARIRNSILRREVIVEHDVEIDDCIIMDYTVIRRGVAPEAGDRRPLQRHRGRARRSASMPPPTAPAITVSDGGVVVVPKGRTCRTSPATQFEEMTT